MAKLDGNSHFALPPNIAVGGVTMSLANLEPISIKNIQRDQSSIQNTPVSLESHGNSPQIEELSPTYSPNQPITQQQKELNPDSLSQDKSGQKFPGSQNLFNQEQQAPTESLQKESNNANEISAEMFGQNF